MNTHVMEANADLSLVSVMQALEKLNELEADSLTKTVKFAELLFAPDLQMMTAAEHVAIKLLRMGVGIKLVAYWPFKGRASWALQTERTMVVNEGPMR